MGGSPAGHSRECFSRNFLASSESMSCWSSAGVSGPFLRVFGLVADPGLGELLFSSAVDLSLFGAEGGIDDNWQGWWVGG